MTVPEICCLLQISRSLVYKWVHYGYIPYIKVGNMVRFKETQIEKWLGSKEKKGRVKYKIGI